MQTSKIPFYPSTPNKKLIRDLGRLLTKLNIEYDLSKPYKDPTLTLRDETQEFLTYQEKVIVRSTPFNGVSFITATVFNSKIARNYSDQVTFSFVANTAELILEKLIQYKLI